MERLNEQNVVCSPEKSKFFQLEVEFCGHILRDGQRFPGPGKLIPLQKWEIPTTITALRSFLGLTNYFSEYVEHYAEMAAPLMARLKVSREDGKKGSHKTVQMGDVRLQAFHMLKACEKLSKGPRGKVHRKTTNPPRGSVTIPSRGTKRPHATGWWKR